MILDERQYQGFLEELHDLKKFQLDYTADNPAARVNWDDPDVQRIIEALAFFGARTHLAAQRSLEGTQQRLYQQFFPYFLTPLPATGMIQAKPTAQLTEDLVLDVGTEFELQPEKGGSGMFCLTRSLRILPMELIDVKQEPQIGQGVRLLLSFQAFYPLNEEVGALNLHINYLNDYSLSLKAFCFFKQYLTAVNVQFGEYDSEKALGICNFKLGLPEENIETDIWAHPLEAERHYFHFPRQELYLDLELPPMPRNWTQFTIALDCNESLPRQLRLHKDLFQLFTAPLINNQRNYAQPVVCDGTKERYTIRHPQPELGFRLQKIQGVYEVTEEGMIPLRNGILAGGNASYEIEQGLQYKEGGYLYSLVPHFPSAFESPRTLVVDAFWQQPWYDLYINKSYTLAMFHRQEPGIKWELVDTVFPHSENLRINSAGEYIHLLTILHKTSFNLQNIKDLLISLGSVSTSPFSSILNALAGMRMNEYSLGGVDNRINKQVYCLQFEAQLTASNELIDTFVLHVGKVLDIWISDVLVETSWEMQDDIDSDF